MPLLRYQKNLRYSLYILIIIIFGWFFLRDLNPSGVLDVSYDLCKPSPYVSEFSPHGRVLDIERKNGHCFQRMVIDPVYVDVRLPQPYEKAAVTLVYRMPDEHPLQAGPWTSATEWQWALEPLEKIGMTDDGWQTAVAEFDIRDRPMDRRRLRFMISSPGLAENGKEIVLREARFTFEKPALGWEMFKRWLVSFVWR